MDLRRPPRAWYAAEAAAPVVVMSSLRLDNRAELARRLKLSLSEASLPDDRVLVRQAYLRWGSRCAGRLLGRFAFVIWDPDLPGFFCARDPFGLAPLYVFRTAGTVTFAFRISDLGASSAVNEDHLADFLGGFPANPAATFYRDVQRAPPAHTLTLSPRGETLQRYWRPDAEYEVCLCDDRAYAEAFRERFEEAVRCRLSGNTGAFLSGGLDSSGIACVAHHLTGASPRRPLDTFSAVFSESSLSDERPYIEEVLRHGHYRPHLVPSDRCISLDDLDHTLAQVEEPCASGNLLIYCGLYRAARQAGVTVVLDGLLGDQVVGHGDNYLTELAAAGRLFSLHREMTTVARLSKRPIKAYRRLFQRYVLEPFVAFPFTRSSGLFDAGPFLQRDFAKRVNWERRRRQAAATYPPRSVRKSQCADLTQDALSRALEMTAKAAAAFGVEPRFPFADRRLLEFCLAVPPTQKYRSGRTRHYMREGLRPYLPEKIRTRYGKIYWGAAFSDNLMRWSDTEVARVLQEGAAAMDYVDLSMIAGFYDRLREQPGRAPHASIEGVWRLIAVIRWLSLQRPTAAPCHYA